MWRALVFLLPTVICGCRSLVDSGCTLGRSRSVVVQDSTDAFSVELSLVEEDRYPDQVGLELNVPRTGNVTGIHLHLRTPGIPDRMVLDLTMPDQDPGPDFGIGWGAAYSLTDSIENLMNLVRSGMTYFDIHLGNGEVLRYDITNPRFSDWTSNCGLD